MMRCATLCVIAESVTNCFGDRCRLLRRFPRGNKREQWSKRGVGGGRGGAEATAAALQHLLVSPAVEMLAATAFFLPGMEL